MCVCTNPWITVFKSLENGLCPSLLLLVHSSPGYSFNSHHQVWGFQSAWGQRINRHLNICIDYTANYQFIVMFCIFKTKGSTRPSSSRGSYSTTVREHSTLGCIHKHQHACTRNVNKRFVYAANGMLKLQSYSNFQFRFLRACNSPSVWYTMWELF